MLKELTFSATDAHWAFYIKACQIGETTIALSVFNNNLDINYVDYQGKTPLMLAVKYNRVELASRLLEMGCDITYIGYQNQNALDIAIENQNVVMVELLLEYYKQITVV